MGAVSSLVLAPVVPPALPAGPAQSRTLPHRAGGARRTLPLPPLASVAGRVGVYGMAAVDTKGRIADRQVMVALGWQPGTRLEIRESHGLVLVTASDHGVFSMTRQGHLRLPATVRRWCDPGFHVCSTPGPSPRAWLSMTLRRMEVKL